MKLENEYCPVQRKFPSPQFWWLDKSQHFSRICEAGSPLTKEPVPVSLAEETNVWLRSYKHNKVRSQVPDSSPLLPSQELLHRNLPHPQLLISPQPLFPLSSVSFAPLSSVFLSWSSPGPHLSSPSPLLAGLNLLAVFSLLLSLSALDSSRCFSLSLSYKNLPSPIPLSSHVLSLYRMLILNFAKENWWRSETVSYQ